jgi:hypothetical protein
MVMEKSEVETPFVHRIAPEESVGMMAAEASAVLDAVVVKFVALLVSV